MMVQHILCQKRPIFNAIFELLGIPILGSNSQTTANMIDKGATRALLLQAGVPIPEGNVFTKNTNHEKTYVAGFPAVVKPTRMENSIGVHLVNDNMELKKALKEAFSYGDTAVVDRFIPGREIRCGIIVKNNGELQPLPCIEYKINKKNIRSYSDKLEGDVNDLKQAASTITRFLDELEDQELVKKVQMIAKDVHKALGCQDFSQIDCRVSDDGQVYVLEANPFCSFGPLSLLTKLAVHLGIEAGSLYAMMIKNVLLRSAKEIPVLKSG